MFELWHVPSRNMVGCFGTKAAARAAIREAVDLRGRQHAEAFALVREDQRGTSRTIATGSHLLDLSLQAPTPPRRPEWDG